MIDTAPRKHLPARRPSVTRELTWAGSNGQATTCTVMVGFRLDGTPAEIFIDGAKIGSTMNLLLQDVAVIVSLALQHNIAPSELAHSMSRVPAGGAKTEVGSVLGAVVKLLVEGLSVTATEPPQSTPPRDHAEGVGATP